MTMEKDFRFVALKITETIRTINPEFAHKLLKYNPKNRRVNYPHVKGLASQMEQGLFMPELGFISFDKKGQMIAKMIIFDETGRFDARLNRKFHHGDFTKAMKKHPEVRICAG